MTKSGSTYTSDATKSRIHIKQDRRDKVRWRQRQHQQHDVDVNTQWWRRHTSTMTTTTTQRLRRQHTNDDDDNNNKNNNDNTMTTTTTTTQSRRQHTMMTTTHIDDDDNTRRQQQHNDDIRISGSTETGRIYFPASRWEGEEFLWLSSQCHIARA